MVSVGISLSGTAEAIKAFQGTEDMLKDALASGLYTEAELVMTDAKANYVPVDTGVLRSSGFVDRPEWRGPSIVEIHLGFGGPADSYALEVHEALGHVHRVGQAKYLEKPMLTAAADLDKHLTATVSKLSEKSAA